MSADPSGEPDTAPLPFVATDGYKFVLLLAVSEPHPTFAPSPELIAVISSSNAASKDDGSVPVPETRRLLALLVAGAGETVFSLEVPYKALEAWEAFVAHLDTFGASVDEVIIRLTKEARALSFDPVDFQPEEVYVFAQEFAKSPAVALICGGERKWCGYSAPSDACEVRKGEEVEIAIGDGTHGPRDRSKAIGKILLTVCAACISAYFFYPHFKHTSAAVPDVTSVTGWDDLLPCSELTSYDGKESLTLSANGSAEHHARGEIDGTKSTGGRWSVVNEKMHVYSLEIERVKPGPYFLVSPERADGCIFAFGRSISDVDLRRSWYSAIGSDLDPADFRERPGTAP